jgi:2'-5' RNA ligase
LRLFTAIEIPQEIRSKLAGLVHELRPLAKLRWSPAENLHITTKFIGEWPESRLPELVAQLEKVPFPGPISITVKNLAWLHRRILHATIQAPPALTQLASATEAALEQIGVKKEDRDFHPHLTLARNPDRISIAPVERAIEKHASDSFGAFTALEFVLFLSKGGKYAPLKEFPIV